ncbi:LON peptidase substrate-binding domain-containing protein [Leeuwenhoekiella sp. MAR_2009_132]|uniref:LON peptidase substrate-binding domain-containing protein n=1 Tax=Leeuwenhoekiella sp. MAR_2009_132 TaxID=1392489 RepID=UPI00048FEA52|nr:LON peptidase substrate-binding domain-containing protein [Leeuwenhoekiella sp. MAR_2009_132]
MTTTLAMFPLEMVVFPHERLALHIFEDRYQQLINDCEDKEITFGVPAYINRKMAYGTEVRLEKIEKKYLTGASDVVCRGLRVFKIIDFQATLEDRLYAGAEVTYREDYKDGSVRQKDHFINLVQRLYAVLEVDFPHIVYEEITSYSFAHKLGLSLRQELHLLRMMRESDRYIYLIDHLTVTIPVIEEINRTRQLIELNGHFKNFNPLDFTDYTLGEID